MRVVAILLLALAASPASAEEAAPQTDADRFTEFAEGLRDLIGDLADDMLPMMENFGNQIKGLGMYEVPEVLPNGDIIIRRKPDVPSDAPAQDDGAVDL